MNLNKNILRVKASRALIRVARKFTHWVWSQHCKALRAMAREAQAETLRAQEAALAAERAAVEAKRTAQYRAEQAQVVAVATEEEVEALRIK